MQTESPLTPDLITADLETTLLPSVVLCYDQIPSTMDITRTHGQVDVPEGLLVLAEEQTAGRGRMGRSWIAPPGSALLFSLLLRPSWMPVTEAFGLTMLTAVSVCEAIEDMTSLRPGLKWPNDVLLPFEPGTGDRRLETAETQAELYREQHFAKVAGILVELELQRGQIVWASVGCGINIHSYPLPEPEQLYPAISLDAAWGQRVERLALLRTLMRRFDTGYKALQTGGYEALFDAWRQRLITLGQQVHVHTPAGVVEGLAKDVLPGGALLVHQSDGTVQTITAGDVAAR